jgi:hypothetical protein
LAAVEHLHYWASGPCHRCSFSPTCASASALLSAVRSSVAASMMLSSAALSRSRAKAVQSPPPGAAAPSKAEVASEGRWLRSYWLVGFFPLGRLLARRSGNCMHSLGQRLSSAGLMSCCGSDVLVMLIDAGIDMVVFRVAHHSSSQLTTHQDAIVLTARQVLLLSRAPGQACSVRGIATSEFPTRSVSPVWNLARAVRITNCFLWLLAYGG